MSNAKLCLFATILLPIATWAQTTPHYPLVIHADLPLYPPIARAAHITGTVKIQVIVEKDAVVDAQIKSVAIESHNGPPLNEEDKKNRSIPLGSVARKHQELAVSIREIYHVCCGLYL